MIDVAIEACANIGLLARPLLGEGRPNNMGDLRVGEAYWSCEVSLAYHNAEDETQICIDLIWIQVKEGPRKGRTFRLTALLNEGLVGVWQILGGRNLRNDLLADIRFYNDSFYDGVPEIDLQKDIDQVLENELKGFVHEDDGQDWRILGTAAEALAGGTEDTFVFDFHHEEKTQPFFILTPNQDAGGALMSER